MLNRAILIGRLGGDVDAKDTANGVMATLNVATSEGYRDKTSGEWKEITDWHQVVTFAPGLVEMLKKHGKKGRLVAIEGKIKTRQYEGDDGQKRYFTEIRVDMDGSIRFLDKSPTSAAAGDDDAEEARPAPARRART